MKKLFPWVLFCDIFVVVVYCVCISMLFHHRWCCRMFFVDLFFQVVKSIRRIKHAISKSYLFETKQQQKNNFSMASHNRECRQTINIHLCNVYAISFYLVYYCFVQISLKFVFRCMCSSLNISLMLFSFILIINGKQNALSDST